MFDTLDNGEFKKDLRFLVHEDEFALLIILGVNCDWAAL